MLTLADRGKGGGDKSYDCVSIKYKINELPLFARFQCYFFLKSTLLHFVYVLATPSYVVQTSHYNPCQEKIKNRNKIKLVRYVMFLKTAFKGRLTYNII